MRYILKKIDEGFLFLWDEDKEVRGLRDEIQRMECFLEDTDMRRDNDEKMKDWVKDLIRVAYPRRRITGEGGRIHWRNLLLLTFPRPAARLPQVQPRDPTALGEDR